MKDPRDIIKRPIVSERSYNLLADRKYTFEVDRGATKGEIGDAIRNIFNVGVEDVNTLNVKPKPKRQGRTQGKTRQWKKAIVTLKEGDKIEIFEGA